MAQHYFVYIHANEFTHFRDQLALVEIKFENNLLPYIELHIKSLMTSNKFVCIFLNMKSLAKTVRHQMRVVARDSYKIL